MYRGSGRLLKVQYTYSSEITTQLTFSEAAFTIRNPDRNGDEAAQYLAGVERALNAYDSILKAKPDAKSNVLDELLEKQSKDCSRATFSRQAANAPSRSDLTHCKY